MGMEFNKGRDQNPTMSEAQAFNNIDVILALDEALAAVERDAARDDREAVRQGMGVVEELVALARRRSLL